MPFFLVTSKSEDLPIAFTAVIFLIFESEANLDSDGLRIQQPICRFLQAIKLSNNILVAPCFIV